MVTDRSAGTRLRSSSFAVKLGHACKAGRKFGWPAKLTSDQAALARRMKAHGETAATICAALGIGRTTLYRYLAAGDED